jgi:hypothetical protein
MFYIVALSATFLTPSSPKIPLIQETFKKHSLNQQYLTTSQFRKTMRELGTDISHKNAHKLLTVYGYNETIYVNQLHDIITNSTTASPSLYFWMNIDPSDNGIRKKRPMWNQFGKAGILTPFRLAHYGFGMGSLFIGTIDLIDYIFTLGIPSISQSEAVCHASIHVLAALFSLPRFTYKWQAEYPFRLWMPTAREANMWPSFILYSWYMCAMNSDFIVSEHTAILTMSNQWFQAFTCFTTAWLLYGATRTINEDDENISGVYSNRMSNILQVLNTMTVPIMADTIKCLAISHNPECYHRYLHLVSQYPEYTQNYMGIALQVMFIGNLVCALSSAEHYGAVSKSDIGDFGNVFGTILIIVSFIGIFSIDEGNLAFEMIDVTYKTFPSVGS